MNSCWQNLGSGDPTSTDDDPEFVDVNGQDYHLSCDSTACIDTADNAPSTGVDPAPYDMDGEDRVQPAITSGSEIIDMGADELTTDSCE
jgi:hypothetical protein